jgi:DNA modification methylase
MTPYYSDDWLTVYEGDCRAVMAEMEPESVHCVVTSPPYWGLRDYGTATWVGGEEGCDHAFKPDAGTTTIRKTQTYQQGHPHRDCRCGATRQDSQLGLEPTPEEYVANMVAVFREVRRVLRADGTVWLNLGDSYASSPPGNGKGFTPESTGLHGGRTSARYQATMDAGSGTKRNTVVAGLKPKDLVGIPWRVAFALQADGWYLRSDIIWAKPNPMPESVTDRPTRAHEYLFLLSKSPRYYFDADAVRETYVSGPLVDTPTVVAPKGTGHRAQHNGHVGRGGSHATADAYAHAGRNLRSVWTVATQPYPGAHFATFPEALVEPCVKAGSPYDGVILDPFAGSGTTGRVAQRLGRRAVLIDLNGEYLKQAMARNADIPLGLGA